MRVVPTSGSLRVFSYNHYNMAEKVEKHSKKESVKISEFEWYEVENKVRQYMHDLLQPFQRKQIDESAKIAELKR